MLNNEHIFKFDDSRLFHLRKYTLGFRQMIVTFELYIVKKIFLILRVVGEERKRE